MASAAPAFKDRSVAAAFERFSVRSRDRLLELRTLIFEAADGLEEIDELVESLKWGQPSYVPRRARLGTPVRLGEHDADTIALYVNCQSRLVDEWRSRFGDSLACSGNRAILFDATRPLPRDELLSAIEMALLYHRMKADWRRV